MGMRACYHSFLRFRPSEMVSSSIVSVLVYHGRRGVPLRRVAADQCQLDTSALRPAKLGRKTQPAAHVRQRRSPKEPTTCQSIGEDAIPAAGPVYSTVARATAAAAEPTSSKFIIWTAAAPVQHVSNESQSFGQKLSHGSSYSAICPQQRTINGTQNGWNTTCLSWQNRSAPSVRIKQQQRAFKSAKTTTRSKQTRCWCWC